MGFAKYAEELRNKASRAAEVDQQPTHPSIAKSRSQPGRMPKKLSADAIAEKIKRAHAKIAAKKQRVRDQALEAQRQRERVLEAKARELLSKLQPMLVEENDQLRKKNERLTKHCKMLSEMLASKSAEIAGLKRKFLGC